VLGICTVHVNVQYIRPSGQALSTRNQEKLLTTFNPILKEVGVVTCPLHRKSPKGIIKNRLDCREVPIFPSPGAGGGNLSQTDQNTDPRQCWGLSVSAYWSQTLPRTGFYFHSFKTTCRLSF
jgi:hypothetical protein